MDGRRTHFSLSTLQKDNDLSMPAKSTPRLPTLRLRGKIVLAAAAVFTAAIAGALFYVVNSASERAVATADELLSSLAQTEAARIEVVLKEHSAVADSIAQTMTSVMSAPGVTAATYKDMFERQIGIVPNAVGIWSLLTADAPTASNPELMASQFALPANFFGPSITRDVKTGAISWGALDLSMESGFQNWFLDPLAKGSPSLVGPYLYDKMLYTSSTSVVRDQAGKAVGLVGVDYNGGVFAQLIGQDRPLGTGWVGIINAEGNWVVPPDPALIGQPANDAAGLAAVGGAKAGDYHASVPVEGQQWRLTATNLPLPQFGIEWTVMVAVPEATLLAAAVNERNTLIAGGLVVFALGLVAFFLLGSSIAKPVSRMTGVMRKLVDGDYQVEVPYHARRDEIGDMAKAVEVFRDNGLKVAEMTEAEAARIIRDQEARTAMMAELQKAFGQVVDAAVAGDFSRRVETEFPDAELNAIAGSINNLVATVDRGLGETGEVLAALADTNLTKRMEGEYEGAFARLRDDTNAVGDKLSHIVGQLKATSRSLKTATGEILSGANDLSERTTKQAATIEETSAAMEQLAVTVLQNAERAREASEVASTVTRTAEEGGQVMGEANAAMERITQSSAKISNIIGLIDDIAFQTNLLALNASVEAARAGDAGKGFAVVAVEVRRLAQSAASASSEVKALIEQSGTEVKTGSKLVADAAGRLAAMLEAARSSNLLMDGIARDSREQASGIEEVNTAVRQLDEMTQHNAALVEQTNAAIEQTDGQVNELDRIVDIFTISGGAPTRAVEVTPPPARGIRGLQERVKQAASSYLSQGNAAIDRDWAEF
ncbi:methyl-accepting chemotaxis protein [Devosia sp. A16]|uniref:methyl-accepting chemotaxis protein n=1 Tax=Devosia sp. A16 TaxID=1736675 RepID=UPI001F02FEFA|nr:methyl-accepting chemotaxis protein [Devosia sp. A16]